jgi:hypothetical protein
MDWDKAVLMEITYRGKDDLDRFYLRIEQDGFDIYRLNKRGDEIASGLALVSLKDNGELGVLEKIVSDLDLDVELRFGSFKSSSFTLQREIDYSSIAQESSKVLASRIKGCLGSKGIKTYGDLVNYLNDINYNNKDSALLRLKNFGRGSLKALKFHFKLNEIDF